MNLKLKIITGVLVSGCLGVLVFVYASDPLGPKLKVDGEVEINANCSLRLKPVIGSAPANPQTGDLYFDGSTLYTWNGSWQAVSEKGDIFYRDSDNSLYFHNGTSWQKIGAAGQGPKTVASRIVAAVDSPDQGRADYVCDGVDDQQEINRAINNCTVGGAVYLLEGTYNISDVLLEGETLPGIVPHNSTAIIGTGKATLLKVAPGITNLNVINSYNVTRILISQLGINGELASLNNGIYFNLVNNSKVNQVWIENMISGSGFLLDQGNYNTVSEAHFQSNQYGIQNRNNSSIFFANDIQSSEYENVIIGGLNQIFFNNRVSNAVGDGIEVYTRGHILFSNDIIENYFQGIEMASYGSIVFGNNLFLNGWGVRIRGSSPPVGTGNLIVSNNIQSSPRGIELKTNSDNNLVFSNMLFDGYLSIEEGSDTNLISSNSLYNRTIYMDSTYFAGGVPSNNYLVSNQINPLVAIRDEAINTTYTDKTKMTLEKRQINISSSPYNITNVATNPRTYFVLNPTVNTTLTFANGKAAGDLLILENINATRLVNITDSGNKNLEGYFLLGQYDSLELIWNGAKWLEIERMDN